ncbi:MAG TPA: (2Fe-2S)-binding protein [Terriglobales bacterium]|nr:(2Fe-2S)-binding protein [Terriglobales bacterium]
MSFTLLINGTEHRVDSSSDETLLSILRNVLNQTGTKYGCGEGQCGACTVLIDGRAVRSCQTPISYAAGKKIITVEGLVTNGKLHPVQQAFLEEEALQCGYCTPGMIMSAVALLNGTPNPSEQEIIRRMDGNVCRCGTYRRIISAIQKAASSKTSSKKVETHG